MKCPICKETVTKRIGEFAYNIEYYVCKCGHQFNKGSKTKNFDFIDIENLMLEDWKDTICRDINIIVKEGLRFPISVGFDNAEYPAIFTEFCRIAEVELIGVTFIDVLVDDVTIKFNILSLEIV